MTRLYLKRSPLADDDTDYGHILSNNIIHLMQALNLAHLCEMKRETNLSFACHLDDYEIGEESIRFDFRLHPQRDDDPLNVVNTVVELLVEPFSLWVLPERVHVETARPLSKDYRIVVVKRPREIEVKATESRVKETYGSPIVPCRSVVIHR